MFTIRTNQGAREALRMARARARGATIKSVFVVYGDDGFETDESDYVFYSSSGSDAWGN